MFINNTQIKKNAHHALDSAHDFFQLSLNSFAKIANLQLAVSKQLVEEASSTIKSITHSSKPHQVFDHVNQFTTTTVEKNFDNYKNVYSLFIETQEHIGKLLESQFHISNVNADNMANWLTKFQATKFDTANSALNSLVKNANQALNAATALTNQANTIASANLKSATKVVENVVESAKKTTVKNVETALSTAKKAATSAINSAIKATDSAVETVKQANTQAK